MPVPCKTDPRYRDYFERYEAEQAKKAEDEQRAKEKSAEAPSSEPKPDQPVLP